MRAPFYFSPVILLAGLLMLALPLPSPADALSELPDAWRDTLHPLPEIDISGAERIAREAMTQTRSRLAEVLLSSADDSANVAEGYGELAALYQLSNIDSAAALCWDNARILQPDEFRWTYYAGYLALSAGHTEQALSLFQRARELNPAYAPLDLRMGQLWLDTDQLDKAYPALERAARESGLRAAALYYLGQIDLLRHDYQTAQQHLGEALSINPEASAVHHPLAQAYRRLGKPELAREHLAQFKHKLPDMDDPLVTELESVLQTPRWEFGLGLQAIMEGGDYKAAVGHFEKGLEIDPANLAARVSYARALYLDGQTQAAQKQLNQVVAEDPQQILANFLLGVLWEAEGKPDEAAARYRRIVELQPEHEGAHFYLANLLFREGRYREAASHYRAALTATSDIPPARVLEMVARHRAGETDSVLARELEQRLTQHPEQSELKYALIRLRALSADAEVRDGVRALTLANELAPGQPTPPNIELLALAAASNGQYQQAVKLQQQVINMIGWMAPAKKLEALQETLAAYEKGVMPQQAVWPADDPLFTPLPLDPLAPFREYPAAVPF